MGVRCIDVCVAEITPAGTYFNVKLAMLLSLVADTHEVLICSFFTWWLYCVYYLTTWRFVLTLHVNLTSTAAKNGHHLYCIFICETLLPYADIRGCLLSVLVAGGRWGIAVVISCICIFAWCLYVCLSRPNLKGKQLELSTLKLTNM